MAQLIARTPARRRGINEINMVPFIDVMLVLLIIFMVSAPLITTGVVDLPTVGKAKARQQTVVEVVVGADEKLQIKQGNALAPLQLSQLTAKVKEAQRGDAQTPVVISAERNVKYEAVVKVMDTLQRAGVQRVGLSVKQAP
jgi:biopolymer transport protein TolR